MWRKRLLILLKMTVLTDKWPARWTRVKYFIRNILVYKWFCVRMWLWVGRGVGGCVCVLTSVRMFLTKFRNGGMRKKIGIEVK